MDMLRFLFMMIQNVLLKIPDKVITFLLVNQIN